MNRYHSTDENDDKRKGLWISIILHIFLLFLFLVPFFKSEHKPEDNLQGITMAFGNPEAETTPKVVQAQLPVRQSSTEAPLEKTKVPAPSTKQSSKVKTPVQSSITEDNEALQAQKEKPTREEKQSLEEAEKMKELERLKEEQRLKKEAEERRRLEEERMRKEKKSKAKSKFSQLLKSGSSNEAANKGHLEGQPDSEALSDLTSGSGKVGTGLGSRELLHAPVIKDNTQKTGRVVINICVNAEGHVMNSKYRQKGSTTTDAHLISLAEKSARKYVFTKSQIQEQCGDIIIDFKLK